MSQNSLFYGTKHSNVRHLSSESPNVESETDFAPISSSDFSLPFSPNRQVRFSPDSLAPSPLREELLSSSSISSPQFKLLRESLSSSRSFPPVQKKREYSPSSIDCLKMVPSPKRRFSLQQKKGEYKSIVHQLMKMSLWERKNFFLGLEDFDIDQGELLNTIICLVSQTNNIDEYQNELSQIHKEEIVKIVLLWRETLIQYYQTFNPIFASQMELFLDTLQLPLSNVLIPQRMNLIFCGKSGQVARSLTSIMFQTFQKIQPNELFDGSWEKGEKYVRSPNVMAMTHNFNRIASVVVESILFCDEIPRSQTLGFMIKLASCLRKMNNFEGMAAVISGLNQAPIRRLKSLWFNLDMTNKKKFEELDQLLYPDKNFQEYQDVLRLIPPHQPVLPWMAPKLRELRYLYDGNQTKTKDGFVNFSHLVKIGENIQTFLQHQDNEFEFVPCDKLLLQYLRTRSVPEEKCYEKSTIFVPLQPYPSSEVSPKKDNYEE